MAEWFSCATVCLDCVSYFGLVWGWGGEKLPGEFNQEGQLAGLRLAAFLRDQMFPDGSGSRFHF